MKRRYVLSGLFLLSFLSMIAAIGDASGINYVLFVLSLVFNTVGVSILVVSFVDCCTVREKGTSEYAMFASRSKGYMRAILAAWSTGVNLICDVPGVDITVYAHKVSDHPDQYMIDGAPVRIAYKRGHQWLEDNELSITVPPGEVYMIVRDLDLDHVEGSDPILDPLMLWGIVPCTRVKVSYAFTIVRLVKPG